jgi:aspartyl aminopeptidase
MHSGVVIKSNANIRYATTMATAFLLREIARRNNIPVQEFVVRNDSPCGSTIGPIISGGTGIRTVDIGNPQLSMHSIREMCGIADVTHAVNLLKVILILPLNKFIHSPQRHSICNSLTWMLN